MNLSSDYCFPMAFASCRNQKNSHIKTIVRVVLSRFFVAISPQYTFSTKTVEGYQVSPAVASDLSKSLEQIESKYNRQYRAVNRRFRRTYARLRLRGTTESTETV